MKKWWPLVLGVALVFVGVTWNVKMDLKVHAAPNCRRYLDKAIALMQVSDQQWGPALAYAKIAEACTKF